MTAGVGGGPRDQKEHAMQKHLSPRRRYLLHAAWTGRVYVDQQGGYWLGGSSFREAAAGRDRKSGITGDFTPLIQSGLVLPPPAVQRPWRRVVGFHEDVIAMFGAA